MPIPTEPGHYWFRASRALTNQDGYWDWEVILVYKKRKWLYAQFCDHDVERRVEHLRGQWGPRIPSPEQISEANPWLVVKSDELPSGLMAHHLRCWHCRVSLVQRGDRGVAPEDIPGLCQRLRRSSPAHRPDCPWLLAQEKPHAHPD